MADDINKTGEGEEIKEPEESKDWQWDAAAPTVGDDFLNLETILPEEKEEINDDETDEASDDEEADSPESENESEEVVIEEPEEEDEVQKKSSDHIGEDGYCIICGNKIKNSESELYCNECRSKYMKVDYGASHIILSILMIFVAVAGIVAFTATSKIAAELKKGDDFYKNNQYSNALDAYNNVSTTTDTLNSRLNAFLQGISTNFGEAKLFDSGNEVYKKTALIQVKKMTIGYTDREALFKTVEEHFSDKDLNSEEYKEVKACYDFSKKLDDTANEVYEIWYPYIQEIGDALDDSGKLTGKYPSQKEIIDALDKYTKEHDDAEPSIMEYFKFNTLSYFQYYDVKVDEKEILSYLAGAYEKAGDFGYIYAEPYLATAMQYEDYESIGKVASDLLKNDPSNDMAYYYLAKTKIADKDFESALSICEDLKKASPDSLEYYIIKATILRLQGEFDAAVDVCEEGLGKGKDVELTRQEAIAYMLAGEEQKALKAATDAYEQAYSAAYANQNVSLEALNTSALIAYLCGDEDTYDQIKQLLSGSQYDFEDSVYQVIKGEKEFKDIFMSGKGDI